MKKLLLFILLTINSSSLFSNLSFINSTGKAIKFEIMAFGKDPGENKKDIVVDKNASGEKETNRPPIGIKIYECNGSPLNVRIMFKEIYTNLKLEYLLNIKQKKNGSFYIEYIDEFQAYEFLAEEDKKAIL